jgi:O-antigen/teichoic acid export membrane protein
MVIGWRSEAPLCRRRRASTERRHARVLADAALRRRDLASAMLSNGAARAASVLTPVLTVPFVAKALGPTQYGVYILVSAVAAMLPVAELGLSLGLMSGLTRMGDASQATQRRSLVSSAFAMQLAVGALVVLVVFGVSLASSWSAILGIPSRSVSSTDVDTSMLVVAACFAASLPGTLIYKVALGMGRASQQAVWQLAQFPLILLAVATTSLMHGSLVAFVAAGYVPPVVLGIAISLWQYHGQQAELRPTVRSARRMDVRRLLGYGLSFTVSGLAAAIAFQTDAIVLSHLRGTSVAAVYGVAYRVGAVAVIMAQGLCVPLWPMFGRLLAARDVDGVMRLLRTSTLAAVAAGGAFAIGFVAFGKEVVRLWVGRQYVPPSSLLLALALWAVVQTAAIPVLVLITSAGTRLFVVVTTASMAATNLVLSIFLVRVCGIAGPAIASVVTYTAAVLVPSLLYGPRVAYRASLVDETRSAESS